jgi:hypothetical protein
MEAFHINLEMASLLNNTCDEDLCFLLQLQEDPANSAQNELFIYICFSVLNSISNTARIRPVYWSVSYTVIRSQCVLADSNTDSVRIRISILAVYGQY